MYPYKRISASWLENGKCPYDGLAFLGAGILGGSSLSVPHQHAHGPVGLTFRSSNTVTITIASVPGGLQPKSSPYLNSIPSFV